MMSSSTKVLIGIKLSLLLALFSTPVKADTDSVAHFGVSYAAQTFTYGLAKRALRLDGADALIFSIFTTMLITTAKECLDTKADGRDIKHNALGVLAASATIVMFDF